MDHSIGEWLQKGVNGKGKHSDNFWIKKKVNDLILFYVHKSNAYQSAITAMDFLKSLNYFKM